MKTTADLLSAAVYARDRLNPYLFNYCLSVALLHRPDTKDVSLDSFVSFFPDKFVDSTSLGKAKRTAEVIPENSRVRRYGEFLHLLDLILFCFVDAHCDT